MTWETALIAALPRRLLTLKTPNCVERTGHHFWSERLLARNGPRKLSAPAAGLLRELDDDPTGRPRGRMQRLQPVTQRGIGRLLK
jgi:hypothetical protein